MERLLSGKNLAYTLMKWAPHKINSIYLIKDKNKDIKKYAEKKGLKVEIITQPLTNDKKGIHQNVWIKSPPFKYKNIDQLEEYTKILILDQIYDPHNFGAISRTAYQFGFQAIVIPDKGGVKVSETVSRISTGAVELLDISIVSNLKKGIEALKKQNFTIYGLDMKGENISSVTFDKKVAFIMGSEGKGIRYHLRDSIDKMVAIPMVGKLDSINVSNAFAIAAWELFK